jgi:hypothetical protein
MVYAMRQAVRSVIKDRRYVFGVVLLLTIGGGGAISLVAFLHAFIFAPFDFRADRILIAHGQFAEGATTGLSAGMAPALAASGAFSHTAVVALGRPQLQGEEPRQLSAAHVTGDFFDIFQAPGTLGDLSRLHSNPRGVVISYDLWRTLGSDTQMVGRVLRLDDGPVDVVAVAPRGFNVPAGTDLWRPLTIDASAAAEHGPGPYDIYLSSDKPMDQARAAAAVIAAPDAHGAKFAIRLERLIDDVSLGFSGAVRLLVWAVVILTATTLTNLYLLSVARARRIAFSNAIHVSLGATRAVLLARGLAEVIAVVVLGCVGALLLSSWLFHWLAVAAPAYLTQVRWEPIRLNVLLYGGVTFAACCASALLGLVPSLAFGGAPRQNNIRGVAAARHGASMRLVIAIQLAVATAVVGTTITLVKTYLRENVWPDRTRTAGVITFEVLPSSLKYRTSTDRSLLFTNVLSSLNRQPTVRSAALTSHLPFGLLSPATAPMSPDDKSATASAVVLEVTRGFFETINLGLRPTVDHFGSGPEGVIITSSLARVLFPGKDPVGRPLLIGRGKTSRIVSVAEDVDLGFRQKGSGFVFLLVAPQALRGSTAKAIVRVDGPAGADTIALVRQAVREVDPQQPLTRLQTLQNSIELLHRAPSFRMIVFLFAAVLAIVVSAIGVASVQGYYLAQRRSEFALRAALGASPKNLLRHGAGMIVPSIAVGCVLGSTFVVYSAGALLRFDASRGTASGDAFVGTGVVIAIALCASAPALIAALRVAPRELLSAE